MVAAAVAAVDVVDPETVVAAAVDPETSMDSAVAMEDIDPTVDVRTAVLDTATGTSCYWACKC